jgi:hypothetical protein
VDFDHIIVSTDFFLFFFILFGREFALIFFIYANYIRLSLMLRFFLTLVSVMAFPSTFNNISVISWRSVLLVEETGVPKENHLDM